MPHSVMDTNVSEDRAASIFRVKVVPHLNEEIHELLNLFVTKKLGLIKYFVLELYINILKYGKLDLRYYVCVSFPLIYYGTNY